LIENEDSSPERCTKSSAMIAVQRLKFRLNRTVSDLCTAGTATIRDAEDEVAGFE